MVIRPLSSSTSNLDLGLKTLETGLRLVLMRNWDPPPLDLYVFHERQRQIYRGREHAHTGEGKAPTPLASHQVGNLPMVISKFEAEDLPECSRRNRLPLLKRRPSLSATNFHILLWNRHGTSQSPHQWCAPPPPGPPPPAPILPNAFDLFAPPQASATVTEISRRMLSGANDFSPPVVLPQYRAFPVPKSRRYDLFVSHAWGYSDEYQRLIDLLDRRALSFTGT